MRMPAFLNERIARVESPFRRLDALLAGVPSNPSLRLINMSVGEPQDSPPALLADAVAAHSNEWNRYPPSLGTPEFRAAVAGYVSRRYPGAGPRLDVDRQISPVTSTREGLFHAAMVAVGPGRTAPLAWMQNPFYQTYRIAALMAGAEARYLRHNGFPEFSVDLRQLGEDDLARTAIVYLCSPSNPDGRLIARSELRRAVEAARRHGFLVVFDECYAELYDDSPPHGALDVLAEMDAGEHWLDNVLVLHSLSKRSSAAGLRSGFAVGQTEVIAAVNMIRLTGAACMPLPLIAASTALWSDDTHVAEMRARLRARKDLADRLLGGFPGYYRPPCGFFLWLRAGDGVALTRRLWSEFALKVLPGEYLTQPLPDGTNEGRPFVRVALVHDPDSTRDGLSRLAQALAIAGRAG